MTVLMEAVPRRERDNTNGRQTTQRAGGARRLPRGGGGEVGEESNEREIRRHG